MTVRVGPIVAQLLAPVGRWVPAETLFDTPAEEPHRDVVAELQARGYRIRWPKGETDDVAKRGRK